MKPPAAPDSGFDRHLQQALRHAPEPDAQVSPAVRERVLHYAAQAARADAAASQQTALQAGRAPTRRPGRWWQALWAGDWNTPRMAGALASVLVAVLVGVLWSDDARFQQAEQRAQTPSAAPAAPPPPAERALAPPADLPTAKPAKAAPAPKDPGTAAATRATTSNAGQAGEVGRVDETIKGAITATDGLRKKERAIEQPQLAEPVAPQRATVADLAVAAPAAPAVAAKPTAQSATPAPAPQPAQAPAPVGPSSPVALAAPAPVLLRQDTRNHLDDARKAKPAAASAFGQAEARREHDAQAHLAAAIRELSGANWTCVVQASSPCNTDAARALLNSAVLQRALVAAIPAVGTLAGGTPQIQWQVGTTPTPVLSLSWFAEARRLQVWRGANVYTASTSSDDAIELQKLFDAVFKP